MTTFCAAASGMMIRPLLKRALDKYLGMDPNNPDMIGEKVALYDLRGKHEEALLLNDSLLQRDPDDPWNLWSKALELLKLNRASEARRNWRAHPPPACERISFEVRSAARCS
jgi:tetratricopeptide (TPR) repeat protein